MSDLTRATEVTPEISEEINNLFAYQPWTEEQKASGEEVRTALALAVYAIVKNVPPSPDRSTAIRKIREARMDSMSGISVGGRY